MYKKELITLKQEFIMQERFDEKSDKTVVHYDHVLKLFLEHLQEEKEIDKQDVVSFKNSLLEQFKPSTISNYVIVVNKFLKYAGLSHFCTKNIKIQQRSSLEEVLEPIEFKRMLRMAKEMGEYDMYLIMKIFAYTGIRVAELKVFTVENIKSNYIRVNNKGKIRNIILRKDLRRELAQYCNKKKKRTGYIFTNNKGKLIHESTIWRHLKRIASNARGIKLAKIHAHSFRHLFAIKFMADGGDLSELADILGHSSIETTRIYTRTTDYQKRQKMERIKY